MYSVFSGSLKNTEPKNLAAFELVVAVVVVVTADVVAVVVGFFVVVVAADEVVTLDTGIGSRPQR